MAVTINASTSAGLVQSADTTGNLNIQSNGSTIVAVTSSGAAVTGTLSSTGDGSISGRLGVGAAASATYPLNLSQNTNNFVRFLAGSSRVWRLGADGANAAAGTFKLLDDSGGNTAWSVDASGRFTVNGTGDVAGSGALLNVTQPAAGDFIVGVRHTHASNPSGMYVYYDSNPNDNAHSFYRADSSAGGKFFVDSNGGIGNYQANDRNLSDIRTKPVFEDFTDEMLDDLEQRFCALRRGRFKIEGQTHNDWNYGKSAQSVAEHLPELSDVWETTKRVEITKTELVDGPVFDANGNALKVEVERKELVEVAIPEDEQLVCEYSHDIEQIGEALLVRALKKIADLERRVAAIKEQTEQIKTLTDRIAALESKQ
jgi:hypothetical protein